MPLCRNYPRITLRITIYLSLCRNYSRITLKIPSAHMQELSQNYPQNLHLSAPLQELSLNYPQNPICRNYPKLSSESQLICPSIRIITELPLESPYLPLCRNHPRIILRIPAFLPLCRNHPRIPLSDPLQELSQNNPQNPNFCRNYPRIILRIPTSAQVIPELSSILISK